jgi:hypothetical protein
MSLSKWVQDSLIAAAAYMKRDKFDDIQLKRVLPKKKPHNKVKARKKAPRIKPLKKAA